MSLIIHQEVKKLKEQLALLIFEYDYLMDYVCPEIESEYILKFGKCEYLLYEIEHKIDRLQRKHELIQIEISNENQINFDELEEKLNIEFGEYEKQLQAQIDEINLLEESEPITLSDSDLKKIKKTYIMLIRRLHPDLNTNPSFLEVSLFFKSTNAFKKRDLKDLETVVRLLPDEHFEEKSEIDDLKDLVRKYEELITKTKNDYPYNKKELLDNKNLENEYKEMIRELIDERNQMLKKLKMK